MTQTITRKPTEISQAAIAHCIAPRNFTIENAYGTSVLIFKGQDVYSIHSDSVEQTYYIFWEEHRLCWNCTCPATKPCKHIRAVIEFICARKEAQARASEILAVLAAPTRDAVICEVCGTNRTYHADGVCGRCRC